jgi:hypothetical protein
LQPSRYASIFAQRGRKVKRVRQITSIEINDRDERMVATNHSEFASWEKVRMKLGDMEVEVEVPILSER